MEVNVTALVQPIKTLLSLDLNHTLFGFTRCDIGRCRLCRGLGRAQSSRTTGGQVRNDSFFEHPTGSSDSIRDITNIEIATASI